MTSDLSETLNSLKLNDDRVRLPTTQRRSNANTHRASLQTKRAVTIDHDGREEKLRVVILGATKVGKTCICQQFLQQKFLIDHKETLDEMYSVELSLVDRRIILEILDTAGIDEFPVMRRIAIAHGDAFLIVYAVNDPSSFDIARQMRDLVVEIKGDLKKSSVPMVIVGNKSDLKSEFSQDYVQMVVNNQWSTLLVETSCRERESVLNAFHHLLQLAHINLPSTTMDIARRSSDPNLSSDKEPRPNKRQSCAQQ